MANFAKSKCRVLPAIKSDHFPFIISIFKAIFYQRPTNFVFRNEMAWEQNMEFTDVIKTAWEGGGASP